MQIRGTLRFLLGNLDDYKPSENAVDYEKLPAVDKYILYKLGCVINEATAAYETYQVGQK